MRIFWCCWTPKWTCCNLFKYHPFSGWNNKLLPRLPPLLVHGPSTTSISCSKLHRLHFLMLLSSPHHRNSLVIVKSRFFNAVTWWVPLQDAFRYLKHHLGWWPRRQICCAHILRDSILELCYPFNTVKNDRSATSGGLLKVHSARRLPYNSTAGTETRPLARPVGRHNGFSTAMSSFKSFQISYLLCNPFRVWKHVLQPGKVGAFVFDGCKTVV